MIYLRQRVGYQTAFLGNRVVEQALEVAKQPKRAMPQIRMQAVVERVGTNPAPSALLGPRGGIPKDKASLIMLAGSLGLSQEGTLAALQTRCRDALGTSRNRRSQTESSRRAETASAPQGAYPQSQPCASGSASLSSAERALMEAKIARLTRANAELQFPMGADLIAVDQEMEYWDLESKTLGGQP